MLSHVGCCLLPSFFPQLATRISFPRLAFILWRNQYNPTVSSTSCNIAVTVMTTLAEVSRPPAGTYALEAGESFLAQPTKEIHLLKCQTKPQQERDRTSERCWMQYHLTLQADLFLQIPSVPPVCRLPPWRIWNFVRTRPPHSSAHPLVWTLARSYSKGRWRSMHTTLNSTGSRVCWCTMRRRNPSRSSVSSRAC